MRAKKIIKKAAPATKAVSKKVPSGDLIAKEDWDEETLEQWLFVNRSEVNINRRIVAVRQFCNENNLEFHCIY